MNCALVIEEVIVDAAIENLPILAINGPFENP
jgi:hypothetical protein